MYLICAYITCTFLPTSMWNVRIKIIEDILHLLEIKISEGN